MTYIQGRTVVHYITRWSGSRQDEVPLCGENSFYRTEAGTTHDSAGWSMNICERCAAIHAEAKQSYGPIVDSLTRKIEVAEEKARKL